jgi:negative regulator of replication initiation
MSNPRTLNFRIDDELYQQLSDAVAEHGGSQSLVARQLLRAALNTPKTRAVAAELTFATVAAQKRALNRVTEIVQAYLPKLIAEETSGMG